MKALTPEPIDRERGKTDFVYFAEKYLDITLSEVQKNLIQQMLDTFTLYPGYIESEKEAYEVTRAFSIHRGFEIEAGPKEFIDV